MHAGGREVKIQPSITEVDFLNENHFEDDPPDVRNCEEGQGSDYWMRNVVIIVPNLFLHEFFGHPDGSDSEPLEDEREYSGDADVDESTEDDLDIYDGEDKQDDMRYDSRQTSCESENPWEADGVQEALQELEENPSAWIQALQG
ncbi:hypothetical protein CC80DRAFT_508355 [Byssothecium circinans]|uniref:Uncharacterized protein n=1 Tax=Byssothecium circinans TaxID=147558 RepID=A0A6A5TJX1_9PLEO|nr:hypothetical protein CC80DRAFT_508355 [Byssothecium circinans]